MAEKMQGPKTADELLVACRGEVPALSWAKRAAWFDDVAAPASTEEGETAESVVVWWDAETSVYRAALGANGGPVGEAGCSPSLRTAVRHALKKMQRYARRVCDDARVAKASAERGVREAVAALEHAELRLRLADADVERANGGYEAALKATHVATGADASEGKGDE